MLKSLFPPENASEGNCRIEIINVFGRYQDGRHHNPDSYFLPLSFAHRAR